MDKDMLSSSQVDVHERNEIAKRNRLQSPLLRLPAELRNRIYGFTYDAALAEFRIFRLKHGRERVKFTRKVPRLVQTCRQVYYEWKPFCWSFNRLLVNDRVSRPSDFRKVVNVSGLDFSKVRVLVMNKSFATELFAETTLLSLSLARDSDSRRGMSRQLPDLELVVFSRALKFSVDHKQAVRSFFNIPDLETTYLK